MDFNQIRYFLALADTLNFTRAAELCHVTQPTLTQGIRRLEDELGGPLVIRDGKNTRLSDLGRALRAHFERIDETKTMLRETARAVTSGERIELNIGLMCTIGPGVLSEFLEAFQRRHPMSALFLHDVTPDVIPDLILSGALDGAFCARHGDRHPKLDYATLFREAMVVAFSDGHVFSQQATVPLVEVGRQRYLDRLHCEFRDEFNALCAEQGVALDIAFSSQREDWVQKMIRDGVGVSVLPQHSLIPPVLPNRPIIEPRLERDVEFATAHGGPKSVGVRSMVEMVKRFPWLDRVATSGTETPPPGA